MARETVGAIAGAPARDLRIELRIRAAALALVLAGLTLLVPKAQAQQPASIRATAYVSHSILAAVVRPDTAGAVAEAAPPPASERIRVQGVGVVEVQRGPAEAVRVLPRALDARGEATVIVQVLNVGS